ncbi:MAG: hypothetical protein WD554_03475 [Flavobacteriaceae bacterium]
MLQTIVIKSVLLVFFFILINPLQAQEIKKEKIYLMFVQNDGTSHPSLGKEFINSNGLNFNLYENYFLHKNEFKKETYPIEKLKCFAIIDESEINKLEREWREKAHPILDKKYKGKYPPYDRNFIFEAYIVEKLKDSIIVYEVIFRNEGVQK